MNASGCGVTVKDYGHILRNDPAYAAKAERISADTRHQRMATRTQRKLRERVKARASNDCLSPTLLAAAWHAVARWR
jgi:glycolate oxidase iron-sulfur subunit